MKKFLIPILVVILIIIIALAIGFASKASNLKADPNAKAQGEALDLVARVGKLIVLPQGEVPTIATVNDPEKLKDQPFFAKAKVGDKVLLYQQAQKAYLYDTVNNKILEIAPINLDTVARPALSPKVTPKK